MIPLCVHAAGIHAGSPRGGDSPGVHAQKRQRILMNILIFGPNGSGKGTQGALLMEKYGIQHIESGAVFRQHIGNGTELGKKAKAYIDKGELVPDDITIPMVLDILKNQGDKGWLLDGFPRTIPQAEALKKTGIPIDFVLEISVPDDEIVRRISGRRVDPVSGRTYHIVYNPPKVEGKDDVTGDPLIQRDDDREEVVRKRLDVYHSQTEALVGFYSDLAKSGDKTAPQYRAISGLGAIDAITARVFEALK